MCDSKPEITQEPATERTGSESSALYSGAKCLSFAPTAEFLIFQIEGKEHGIEVYYKDKTVWCTQKAMGMLFDCSSDNISVHLQNIYDTDELKKEATTEKISVVRREGNRDVNRTLTERL